MSKPVRNRKSVPWKLEKRRRQVGRCHYCGKTGVKLERLLTGHLGCENCYRSLLEDCLRED